MEKPGSLTSSASATCDRLTTILLQRHARRTHTRGTGQASRGHQAAQTEGRARVRPTSESREQRGRELLKRPEP